MGTHQQKFGRAIVVGGGFGGSLASATLAKYFQQVLVLDRGDLNSGSIFRKGVPQGRHAHVMLAGARRAIEALFPGYDDDLAAAGAPLYDVINDVWEFTPSGATLPRFVSGIEARAASRGLFESTLRTRIDRLDNVEIRSDVEVSELCFADGVVTGVKTRHLASGDTQVLDADVVVCSPGHSSKLLSDMLAAGGYVLPRETVVTIEESYATRFFRLTDTRSVDWVLATIPGANAMRLEADKFLVCAWDEGEDGRPPTNEQAFMSHLKGLAVPDFHELAERSEPISRVSGWKKSDFRIRHYDEMTPFPRRLLILGDAVCTLNPEYGHGMAMCVFAASLLDSVLRECRDDCEDAVLQFRQRLPGVFEEAWWMAANSDLFKYPETTGPEPDFGTRAGMWIIEQLQNPAINQREDLWTAMYRAQQLERPLTSLLEPEVLIPFVRAWLAAVDQTESDEERASFMPRITGIGGGDTDRPPSEHPEAENEQGRGQ